VIVDEAFLERTPTTAPSLNPVPISALMPTLSPDDAATTPFPRLARGTMAPDDAPPSKDSDKIRHARLELPLPLPVRMIDSPRRWGPVVKLNRPRRARTRVQAPAVALEPSSAGPLAFAVLASLSVVLTWLYWLLP
jgi:hypothetical protein